MRAPDSDSEPKRMAGEETYSWRSVPNAAALLSQRRAETYAAFFIPYLHSGMRLLDCGCGPGSISCDLARIVAPGEVVGIDFDPVQVEAAVAYAGQQGVTNVRYQTASVYELPFPESSFDAVFAHALFDHLAEPLKALREMRRVLRSGGPMGVRTPDLSGLIIAPPDSACAEVWRLIIRLQLQNGEDPFLGKHLRALFHQVGCVRVVGTASYESHGCSEALAPLVNGVASTLGRDGLYVRAGIIEPERAVQLTEAFRAWAQDPAAFLARTWCEAVGWAE
jgi:ubiquinone/menaquinone biosynthesis C-methylase UbiE